MEILLVNTASNIQNSIIKNIGEKMRKLIFILAVWVLSTGLVQAYDETIYEVYDSVAEKSADKKSFDDILMASLGALKKYDTTMRFAGDGDRISIYRNGRMLESFAKPKGEDPEKWAEFTQKLLDYAVKSSPKISLYDFEVVDEMMAAAVLSLKDDSKYHKAMDLADNLQYKAKSSFGSNLMGEVLYVRLALFDQDSAENVRTVLKAHEKAKALILDLRGNPGGSLNGMIEVADMFLDGVIVASTRGNGDKANNFYTATEGELWNKKPIVVLVDAKTASSAEALSVALQEQSRAKLVGTRTYGKGTIQELIKLEDGAELLLTVAEIYAPSGKEITGEGVNPDICMAFMNGKQKPKDLVRQVQKGPCPRESRMDKSFDVKLAIELINKKL